MPKIFIKLLVNKSLNVSLDEPGLWTQMGRWTDGFTGMLDGGSVDQSDR